MYHHRRGILRAEIGNADEEAMTERQPWYRSKEVAWKKEDKNV
jgi:hypothetical protein